MKNCMNVFLSIYREKFTIRYFFELGIKLLVNLLLLRKKAEDRNKDQSDILKVQRTNSIQLFQKKIPKNNKKIFFFRFLKKNK